MEYEVKLIPTDYPEVLEDNLAKLMSRGWELVGSVNCLEDIGRGSTATRITLPHILLRRKKEQRKVSRK